MENITHCLYWIISVLAILSVLIPAIKNTYWTFRVFDYPRFQKFIILLILIFAWFFTFENPNIYEYLILAFEVISAGYLLYIILPYTDYGKTMIDKTQPNQDEKPLDILVCNVYQHNRNYQKLKRKIHLFCFFWRLMKNGKMP